MQRFRNILVAIDGDHPPQGVLVRAGRLARQNGASLKLIAVVEHLPWYARLVLPSAEELQALLVRARAETLERLAGPLRQAGAAVSTGVLQGRRSLEIVREVLRGGYDLLIVVSSAAPSRPAAAPSTT